MSDYWENRAAWDMYHAMEDAEKTAQKIARIYRKALTQLTYAARDVFDKYRKDYGLSEVEAWELLNKMQDKASIDELLLALRNEKTRKGRQDILEVLEAPAYTSRIERFKDMMQQVDFLMQNVYEQEKQFDTTFFENLARDSYYKTIYNTQRQTGYGFAFSNISEKEIAHALSINWSGKHYSKRIWKNTQDLAETIKEEMVISLLTGRTDREAAQTFEKTFHTGMIQARRLVRTESAFVHGELQKMAYKEAGIKKYRYVAILDLRTSELCRGLDGKTFSVSEAMTGKNYPPMHPWCRSTTINIVDDEILKNMKRNAYDPETGRTIKVPANMTYKEWYKQYVKGNPKAEAQEKAVKNAARDRRQFDAYQKVLGKDMPKHFADFQEMKYNEPEKWEQLKALKQYFEKNPGNTKTDYEIGKALKDSGIKGIPKVNPEKIDVSDYTYDTNHINAERAHMVSREEAENFIKKSDISLTRWNGRFVNYYSKDGAAYVDVENKNIRTAFSSKEFDENTLKIRKVVEKYAGGNHVSNIQKND